MPTPPLLFYPASQPCAIHVHCSAVGFRLPGARGSNHRRRLPHDGSHPPCLCAHFLALSVSPPASVPLNCRGWLLYSKGPIYCSTPLTLQGSGCSDVGTLGHTHGSICLPLEHTERCKSCFNIFKTKVLLHSHF